MYVQVDLRQELVYVEDLHETRSLALVVSGGTAEAAVDGVLGDAGRIDPQDDDHALLSVDWVRAAAGAKAGPGWGERFDALLDHAREKGSLSDDGGTIRVHVEYTMLDE